jgi:hypothetical protein
LQHLLVTNAVVLILFRVPITLPVLEAQKEALMAIPLAPAADPLVLLLALFLADIVPTGNRVQ